MKKRIVKKALAFVLSAAMISSMPAASNLTNVTAAKKNVKLNVSSKTLTAGKTFKLKLKNNSLGWAIRKAVSKNSKICTVQNKKTYAAVTAKKAGSAKVVLTIARRTPASKTVRKKLACSVKVKSNAPSAPSAPSVPEIPTQTQEPSAPVVPSVPSAPAETARTVETQEQLDAALAASSLTAITLKTDASDTFVIPASAAGSYNADLTVDAPNADIENSGVFKSVTVNAIKETTWIEKASGNKMNILSSKGRFIVETGASLSQVVFKGADAVVELVVNGTGTVGNVTVETKLNLVISGTTTANVPVNIAAEAKDASLQAKAPVDIKAQADVKITLEEGAEKSTIEVQNTSSAVDIKNNSKEEIKAKMPDGSTKTAAANGGSAAIKPSTGPSAATPSTPAPSSSYTPPDSDSGSSSSEESVRLLKSIALNKTALSLETGSTYELKVTPEPADASISRIKWESQNTAAAVVDENGKVTAVAAGRAEITAKATDRAGNTKNASCTVTVTIGISNADIADITGQTYTGGELTPALTVTLGGKILTKDTDYTAVYDNNVNATTETAKAKVTITGKGNYSGEKIKTFTISPKPIAGGAVEGIAAVDYTGNAVTFDALKVTLDGRELKKGTDYDAVYENNVNATTEAKVTITGKGNYSGEIVKKFTINQKQLSAPGISVAADAKIMLEKRDKREDGIDVEKYSLACEITARSENEENAVGGYKVIVKQGNNVIINEGAAEVNETEPAISFEITGGTKIAANTANEGGYSITLKAIAEPNSSYKDSEYVGVGTVGSYSMATGETDSASAVARLGKTGAYYSTLQDAITAAGSASTEENKTVTMITDVEISTSLNITNGITLDGNAKNGRHEIKANTSIGDGVLKIKSLENVTIKDLKINANEKGRCVLLDKTTSVPPEKIEVKMMNCDMMNGKTTKAGGGIGTADGQYADLTLEGGVIKNNESKSGSGVFFGNVKRKLTITGTTITENTLTEDGYASGIWIGSEALCEINSGTTVERNGDDKVYSEKSGIYVNANNCGNQPSGLQVHGGIIDYVRIESNGRKMANFYMDGGKIETAYVVVGLDGNEQFCSLANILSGKSQGEGDAESKNGIEGDAVAHLYLKQNFTDSSGVKTWDNGTSDTYGDSLDLSAPDGSHSLKIPKNVTLTVTKDFTLNIKSNLTIEGTLEKEDGSGTITAGSNVKIEGGGTYPKDISGAVDE